MEGCLILPIFGAIAGVLGCVRGTLLELPQTGRPGPARWMVVLNPEGGGRSGSETTGSLLASFSRRDSQKRRRTELCKSPVRTGQFSRELHEKNTTPHRRSGLPTPPENPREVVAGFRGVTYVNGRGPGLVCVTTGIFFI